jgi:hypothetical protein
MTKLAKTTFGNQFWMGPAGGTLVMVAELTKIGEAKTSRDTNDGTTHDSPGGAQEFVADGIYDPGEMQHQGNYLQGSVGDIAMDLAMKTGALQDFKIVSKGVTVNQQKTAQCIVTEYGPEDYGDHTMRFGALALAHLQEELGVSMSGLAERLNQEIGMPETITLIHAGLMYHHPDIEKREVAGLIDDIGFTEIGQILGDALKRAFPSDDQSAEGKVKALKKAKV